MILGVKGSSLQKDKVSKEPKQEDPAARLKLLLIATFLSLHALNLVAPFTTGPSQSSHSHNPLGVSTVRKVDVTTPALNHALTTLAGTEEIDSDDYESENGGREQGLIVKVNPPVHVRVVPSLSLLSSIEPSTSSVSSRFSYSPSSQKATGGFGEWINNFMNEWTKAVGDPIMSKWIVIVLALSISLNGYLLRGIGQAVSGANKVKAARFETKEETKPEPKVEVKAPTPVEVKPKLSAPLVPIIAPAPPPPVKKAAFTVGSNSASTSDSESSSPTSLSPSSNTVVRPLKELIEIYDNGPKPVSIALQSLNDEEVITLAQNGKIAAYALEKVMGNTREGLERAVRVRRALICECFFFPLVNYD